MTNIRVSENLPVRTQFLFFTLFGDYVLHLGGKIWTSSIVQLMGVLGVSERAVRSTLSRMTRKGWIKPKKFGRRSQYALTSRGRALLESGQRRIFEPSLTDWDNTWHILVYSLPEKKRRTRHVLRKQLTWLGFGRLAPGTWISPHGRRAELRSMFKELEIENFVELFSGVHYGPSTAKELIQRCWDLTELENQYKDFVTRYQPIYEKHRQQIENNQCPAAAECFTKRFWLTHEFQSMPLKDPNLPAVLLQPDWIGFIARNLVDEYRKLLKPFAFQYVREAMNVDGVPQG